MSETEKRCVRCKQVKPVADFYQRARTYRYAGRVLSPMSLCIDCHKASVKSRYKHRRPVVPEGMKWCGRCRRSKPIMDFEPNRARADGLQNYCRECRKSYQRFAGKHRAKMLGITAAKATPKQLRKRAVQYVGLAVFFGDLIRKDCEVCGAKGVQAHHTDYFRPLAVTWLCPACHSRVHNGRPTGPLVHKRPVS